MDTWKGKSDMQKGDEESQLMGMVHAFAVGFIMLMCFYWALEMLVAGYPWVTAMFCVPIAVSVYVIRAFFKVFP